MTDLVVTIDGVRYVRDDMPKRLMAERDALRAELGIADDNLRNARAAHGDVLQLLKASRELRSELEAERDAARAQLSVMVDDKRDLENCLRTERGQALAQLTEMREQRDENFRELVEAQRAALAVESELAFMRQKLLVTKRELEGTADAKLDVHAAWEATKAELEALKKELAFAEQRHVTRDEYAKQTIAEFETLKAERDQWKRSHALAEKHGETLEAELDQLRTAAERLMRIYDGDDDGEIIGPIAQLRAALSAVGTETMAPKRCDPREVRTPDEITAELWAGLVNDGLTSDAYVACERAAAIIASERDATRAYLESIGAIGEDLPRPASTERTGLLGVHVMTVRHREWVRSAEHTHYIPDLAHEGALSDMAKRPGVFDDDDDDDRSCSRCRSTYALDDMCEPTKYCHHCAQELVTEFEAQETDAPAHEQDAVRELVEAARALVVKPLGPHESILHRANKLRAALAKFEAP